MPTLLESTEDRMASMASNTMRARFSGLPPYLSVRRFVPLSRNCSSRYPFGSVELYAIETRLQGVLGRVLVVIDDAWDLADFKRAGGRVRQAALDGRGEALHSLHARCARRRAALLPGGSGGG
jgi:hypothetical protein